MLRRLGESHFHAGRFEQAIDLLTQSRDVFAELGEPLEQTLILTWLGRSLAAAGRTAEALDSLRWARAKAEELGARHAAAEAGMYLADALATTGNPVAAREHLTQALETFVDLQSPKAEDARRRLEELDRRG